MKAVIPAAGFGIRFLPLTKEQPKEMLPVVHKPTIQYVVEEAVSAGITDILIITGRGKRSIEDHFDSSPELEKLLLDRGRTKELDELRAISEMANIHFIRQKVPRGLGDAVLLAKHHVGKEPFVVMLGDTINVAKVPVARQLIDAQSRLGGSVIAVEPVAREKIKDYGIIPRAPRSKTGPISSRTWWRSPVPNRLPPTWASPEPTSSLPGSSNAWRGPRPVRVERCSSPMPFASSISKNGCTATSSKAPDTISAINWAG
jgi:UTP-glucose-1-phosphate uridylyltransferase